MKTLHRYLLSACMLVCFQMSAQSFFQAQPLNVDSFPAVTGEFWSREYGDNVIKKESLEILENNKPVNFTLDVVPDSAAQQGKKRVLILVENHWVQPRANEVLNFTQQVTRVGLEGTVKPGDEVSVYSFNWLGKSESHIVPVTGTPTDNADTLISAISSIRPGMDMQQVQEGSDINRALLEALALLPKDSIPTAIILFSDGYGREDKDAGDAKVAEEARKRNIPIYTITYTYFSKYGQYLAANIAQASFGTGNNFEKGIDGETKATAYFMDIMTTLVKNARGTRYRYSYTSEQKKDGQSITVSFRLSGHSYILPEDVSANLPVQSISEWVEDNKSVAGAIGGGAVVVISLIVMLLRKRSRERKLQAQELSGTKSELQTQKEKAEQEKRDNAENFRRLEEEQRQKERKRIEEEQEAKRRSEEENLATLMHKKGAFAKLIYSWEDNTGEVVISKPVFIIGREQNCDFYMQLDTVSRRHATIAFNASGTFRVIDNNSSNGVFLNGVKVTEAELKNGDVMEMGGVQLTFMN